MADSRAQVQAEKWVVNNALLQSFPNKQFRHRKIRLTWGGEFDFDAVSDDGSVVALVSTIHPLTAKGKLAVGKIHKLKADALYLLHAEGAKRRVMVFTQASMMKRFEKEKGSGRFPPEIELLFIRLPKKLQDAVEEARRRASEEVSPRA